MGALLFLIYANDLLELPFTCQIKAFPDNSKLFGQVTSDLSLQEDICKFSEFFHANGMEVNDSKCKVIHFGFSNPRYRYTINGGHINETSAELDLEVMIVAGLTFFDHIASILPRIYSLAHRFFSVFHSKSPIFYLRLFNLYIFFIISYGLPLAFASYKKSLKVTKFLKYYSKMIFKNCNLPMLHYNERAINLDMKSYEDIYVYYSLAYLQGRFWV